MVRPLPLLALLLTLSACSLVPNATVRVALPPGDPETAARWQALLQALPPTRGAVPVETVGPGAFPPADLVWFDGDFADPAFTENALAPNGQVEALGTGAGLAPGWFAVDGDRVLPLAVSANRPVGLWWNQGGWNRDAVPGLLARLWSAQAQAVWARLPGFQAANTGVFPRAQAPELQAAP